MCVWVFCKVAASSSQGCQQWQMFTRTLFLFLALCGHAVTDVAVTDISDERRELFSARLRAWRTREIVPFHILDTKQTREPQGAQVD